MNFRHNHSTLIGNERASDTFQFLKFLYLNSGYSKANKYDGTTFSILIIKSLWFTAVENNFEVNRSTIAHRVCSLYLYLYEVPFSTVTSHLFFMFSLCFQL